MLLQYLAVMLHFLSFWLASGSILHLLLCACVLYLQQLNMHPILNSVFIDTFILAIGTTNNLTQKPVSGKRA
jgi:hypothetical protein